MVPGGEQTAVPERDATLDAFVSSSEDDDTEGDEASDSGENTDGERPPVADAAAQREAGETRREDGDERAETTFAWSPDGTACEACGTVTDRRWRTDAGFVCPSCVDWERTPNQ